MDSLIKILNDNKISELTFVDVGAKDKLDFITELKSLIVLHAFEPITEEYNKLKEKYKNNFFKELFLNEQGLSDFIGTAQFNVTKHNSMSSLLEVDVENYRKHFGNYSEFCTWSNNVSVEKKINIELQTLDSYFEDKDSVIDYLKIDTQGSELIILKGAEKLLQNKKISVIKVEVCTIPIYKNQALFSDIDVFLRSYGYILVDFVSFRKEYRSTFKKQKAHYAPCGDAIYILQSEPETNENRIKKAILLSWLGYKSLSQNLVTLTKLELKELNIILSIYNNSKLLFLKKIIKNSLPPYIFNFIKACLR